ncbi:hypothetical protein HBH51_071770 [Parastagonospora nodorum]|nr:hypothetical protein HBH51_071770 [Parastagonospora nodorum]KAH6433537.1 hypothetical protein HBI59_173900 [Parastagonospora nodorum]
MSSPYSNQQPLHGWTGQYYQQPSIQKQDDRNSYGYYAPIIQQPHYTPHYAQQPAPYVQPYYGNAPTAPIIAELPAPLPPAPPTTTSDEQLKEDQLLASKIQQLEVAEIRSRSNSAVSQHQRPVSMAIPQQLEVAEIRSRSNSAVSQQQRPISIATPRLDSHSPLVHQTSTLSLRPYSTNVSTHDISQGPGSFGALPRNPPSSSLFPEVVPDPRRNSYDPSNDLPIPVEIEQRHVSQPQSIVSDPTSLPLYLETHRQVPYPPTWRLPPVVATFYAHAGSKTELKADWLSQQESFTWRTIRPTEHAYNPAAPSYTFRFSSKGGSFRDPKFSWIMTLPGQSPEPKKKGSKSKETSWTYELRLDLSGGMRKKERLNHGSHIAILTTYVHALNYDSLRFIGPDGRAYMWVSGSQVSSVNGMRYDTVRHALFAAVGHIKDPLYGEIVADHTFWDGHVDEVEVHAGAKCDGCQTSPINGLRWKCKVCHQHDVCEPCRQSIIAGDFGTQMQQACQFSLVCLPDEALYIRSPTIDPALVVATLQILKDWEKHTFRDEKRRNPKGFQFSEEITRNQDLGIMSYWRASDFDKKDKKNSANEKMGTVVKAKSITMASEGTASALSGLVDAGSALAGHGTSGSTHRGSVGGDGRGVGST